VLAIASLARLGNNNSFYWVSFCDRMSSQCCWKNSSFLGEKIAFNECRKPQHLAAKSRLRTSTLEEEMDNMLLRAVTTVPFDFGPMRLANVQLSCAAINIQACTAWLSRLAIRCLLRRVMMALSRFDDAAEWNYRKRINTKHYRKRTNTKH
jgi:hypothetical protein